MVTEPSSLGVEVRMLDAGVHVLLAGEHDLSTALELEKTFDRLLAVSPHLIVDLSTCDFIDSSTIRALVMAKTRAEARGRRFTLVVGGGSNVARVLELAQVLPHLNKVGSIDEAVAVGNGSRAAATST